MNSKTSDFSELRKSSENESHYRGTLSSAKRRPFFMRKLVNLTPLNLNEIKREVEAEKNRTVNFTFPDSDNDSESISECEGSDACENTLKDISNTIDTAEKSEDELIPNLREERSKPWTSAKSWYEPEKKTENNTQRSKSNDSFDLDFSALSLSTPVKQKKVVSMTPRVNTLSVCHEAQVSKFDGFVTPKVKNILPAKPQLSNYKNNSLVTPKNPLKNSQVKAATPFSDNTRASAKKETDGGNVLYTIPKQVLRDGTFTKIVVKQEVYLVLSILGRGGSSEVFQCYNLEKKHLVAIKCVSLENSASASSYINEVKLLQQLQYCDKIIKMYDFEILNAEKKLYMVLEKGGDDLSTILRKLASQSTHIPTYTLLFYWMDMLHAVKQIHSHGVIHSDLKPSNFIKADGGLKLIDFGIASSVQNDETSVFKTSPEGSCNYISPEALNNDSSSNASDPNSGQARYKVHYKSDVWSLGCILYQLVYRRTPFTHLSHLWTKLAYILNPEHKIEYPEVNWVSPRILDTIKKCLQYNVKSRPSVDELIEEYEAKLLNI